MARALQMGRAMKQPTPVFLVLSFGATALIAHTAPASADDRVATVAPSATEPLAVTTAAPVERHHSLNANPMGVLFGSYGLTYEYLSGGNGLLVEGGLSHSGGDDASSTSYGGAVGYRWHWRGRQNSGFLGANVGFYGGTGRATIDDGSGTPESFDMTVQSLQVVMNVGKRWHTDPDAQEAVEMVQDILDFIPIALDGELSLGYSF
jgi:hypothetical protein